MKNIYFLFVLIIFFLTEYLSAQGAFTEYSTSHYARTIRLGNTYTGIAEGAEALYYNPAGIANSNSYELLFSNGIGLAPFVDGTRPYDYAVVTPLPENLGTVGFSAQTFYYIYFRETQENIFNLSYAYQFFNSLSVGLTAGYYHFHAVPQLSIGDWFISEEGSAIDLSLGVLYQLPANMKISDQDNFKIGLYIKNFLNSKIKLDPTDKEYFLNQNIRAGISYRFIPSFSGTEKIHPIQLLAAIDLVYSGRDYDFRYYYPNYAVELSLYEILEISFGRESEKYLRDPGVHPLPPQYPVNRYGIGLNAPLHLLFDSSNKMTIKFNYCKSDWEPINEENVNLPHFSIKEMDDDAFSIGFAFEL
ncbi:MAG: hypothetical protein IPM56_17870 [Ignavibacteriales bacterium]|nr:MAG: hypothetical protein IPM56_17870 [Ignavibacteriales bacterium]